MSVVDVHEVADTLEQAADLIEVGGLCKYALSHTDGRHCAGGALIEAGPGYSLDVAYQAAMALTRKLELSLPSKPGFIEDDRRNWAAMVNWNNHPDRTAADVAEAMRSAAKDLRNGAVLA